MARSLEVGDQWGQVGAFSLKNLTRVQNLHLFGLLKFENPSSGSKLSPFLYLAPQKFLTSPPLGGELNLLLQAGWH